MTTQEQLHALNTIPPNLPAYQAAHLLIKAQARRGNETDLGKLFLDGYVMALECWLSTEGFERIVRDIRQAYDELKEAHAITVSPGI